MMVPSVMKELIWDVYLGASQTSMVTPLAEIFNSAVISEKVSLWILQRAGL